MEPLPIIFEVSWKMGPSQENLSQFWPDFIRKKRKILRTGNNEFEISPKERSEPFEKMAVMIKNQYGFTSNKATPRNLTFVFQKRV